VVCFAAARDGLEPAVGCLYNLGVLLRVLEGPVLLVGSEAAYRDRFSFRFRPDRERLSAMRGHPAPGGVCGPLGVRLLRAGGVEWNPGSDGCGALRLGRALNGTYRYLLTDDLSSAARLQDLPGMALFVITPRTDPDAIRGGCTQGLAAFCLRTGYAGVVTAGTVEGQEGAELFRLWKERLTLWLPGTVQVANVGCLPRLMSTQTGESGIGLGMRVLEAPVSPEARCFLAMAARIRKRRVGLLQGLPPEGLAPGRGPV